LSKFVFIHNAHITNSDSASTIGCVVRVDREVLRVVDQQGDLRTLLHTQVSQVVGRNKHAVATDRDGSEIREDDDVKEFGGESRQGKVIYIHRGTLFVRNREQVDNQGIFVVRSSNVVTMAAKSGRAQAQGPDLSGINPALNAANGNAGAGMPPPRNFGRDKLIGKTVVIRKGPYKGLLGIVKDTMNDEARIELHTKNKQISVKKELLSIKDPITGNSMPVGGAFPNRSRGGGFAGSTPSYNAGGGRTPAWGNAGGGRTPGWGGGGGGGGGRTPGWGGGGAGAGGRTPGWGGDGGRTAYGGGDGSRTAYGGDGSRTAYGGGGGATAYGGATSYGGGTSYGGANDGSRTAYGGFNANSGNRTPGWGGSTGTTAPKTGLSAPTPGAYNAPTPGAYAASTPGAYGAYSAPTPGGPMDAPTPGIYSAPTPAAAPTPGAWEAATPAPSGEDPGYH
jgi:transcription elongation factor SPT5